MPVRIQKAFKIPDRQEQKKIPPHCLRIKLLIYVGENAGVTWRPIYWAHCTSNKKHGTQHVPEVRTPNYEVA